LPECYSSLSLIPFFPLPENFTFEKISPPIELDHFQIIEELTQLRLIGFLNLIRGFMKWLHASFKHLHKLHSAEAHHDGVNEGHSKHLVGVEGSH
jgi:hypothetical protein